ncbi:hypothetical protein AAWM_04822 [Aspergillus awamori]|uniref:Uncharacterized protein n=1 Tax=Aspergillus awamori TaxID=105351 RepID=A0A401KRU6_ASPAW|nr:hypothetical protein AAWM_04822 [Aspergillus awamori]
MRPIVADVNDNDGHIELKRGLCAVLETIESSGSFLTQDLGLGLAIPGLNIAGLGNIRLPISADDAKAITQCCDRSPYGKGSETLVDESVRKTWQLDPGQFSLQNPLWQQQMDDVVDDAVTGLGLTAQSDEVQAELYKLLIYEEGAFFLPHQDTEKADGMFATLVVCLPSKHEGGTLVASHRDWKIAWSTASSSEFSFSWAAWYADVIHEVRPVTSGYRVALVYNLIHRPLVGLGISGVQTDKLTHLLESWVSDCSGNGQSDHSAWDHHINGDCPPALVYILEHQYTVAELSFDRLKGVDQVRFGELQKACQGLDCDLYLANIEKTRMGGVDGRYGNSYWKAHNALEDVLGGNQKLLSVVDASGSEVGKRLPFHGKLLIQEDFFSNRLPDDEKYQGFTGNEAAKATRVYRATGAIIVPNVFRSSFILHRLIYSADNIADLLDECHQLFSEQPDNALTKRNLVRACQTILKKHSSSSEMRAKVMQIAIDVDDVILFCQTLVSLEGTMSSSEITQTAKVLAKHGLEAIRLALERVFQDKPHGPSLPERVSCISKLLREYRAICQERGRAPSVEMLNWESAIISNYLSCYSNDTEPDGRHLVDVLTPLPQEGLFERIIPFLETKIERTACLGKFFVSVYVYSRRGKFDQDAVDAMLKNLLPKFFRGFRVQYKHTSNSGLEFAANCRPTKHTTSIRIDPKTVVGLIKLGDVMDVDNAALFHALTEYTLDLQARDMPDVFTDFLLPVANGVCENVITSGGPSTNSERRFVKHILKKYITGYVLPAPLVPPDWKGRSCILCRCYTCASLDTFIEDPAVRTRKLHMGGKDMEHFDRYVDDFFFTKTVVGPVGMQMLRIWKTDAMMLVSQLHAWNKRARDAKAQLDQLDKHRSLKEILGNTYDSLMNHPNLTLPDDHPAATPTAIQAGHPMSGSVVPSKRRQE